MYTPSVSTEITKNIHCQIGSGTQCEIKWRIAILIVLLLKIVQTHRDREK